MYLVRFVRPAGFCRSARCPYYDPDDFTRRAACDQAGAVQERFFAFQVTRTRGTQRRCRSITACAPSSHLAPGRSRRLRCSTRQNPSSRSSVEHFPTAVESICTLMSRLREALCSSAVLKDKLFQANFLATQSGELMVTLIYHRLLDDDWQAAAAMLAPELGIELIGQPQAEDRHRPRLAARGVRLQRSSLALSADRGSFTNPTAASIAG